LSRDAVVAAALAQLEQMLSALLPARQPRREQAAAAAEDTAALDALLAGLEELARQRGELEFGSALLAVVRRHGPGPYGHEELMALSGLADVDVSTALLSLRGAGLLVDEDKSS